MPLLIPALVSAMMTVLRVLLMAKIGAFIVAALLFFGFTWATNEYAVDPLMDSLTAYVGQLGSVGGVVGSAVQWAGVLQFDKAITLVVSAYGMAWTIKSARVWLSKAE